MVAAAQSSGEQPALIVMVVANDVSTDTRVRKMAHDLSEGGLRVIILGVSTSRREQMFALGSADVRLLPVEDHLRSHPRLGRGFGRRHRLSKELAIRKANYFSHQRTVAAEIGWLRTDYFEARRQRNANANERARRRQDRESEWASSGTRFKGARSPLLNSLMRWKNRVASGVSRRGRAWSKRRRQWTEQQYERWFHFKERSVRRRLKLRHRGYLRKEERLERKLNHVIFTGDRADWRHALPELHDYDVAFSPILDSLQPDLIHAQDIHLLGVAARSVARAKAAGRNTKLIYDAHEYIPGLAHPRPAKGWTDLESEFIRHADAVITVAPAISDLVQRDYGLRAAPTVVMNIPSPGKRSAKNLREVVGVSESATLLVYSGGMDSSRGVHTLVQALGQIPDVHLALVSNASTSYTTQLEDIATRGGYRDRVHFAPFVEPQDVVSYLKSADVGVHTIVSGPVNHEVTLPNKVFEYMHARLPIVISDCRAMSEFVKGLEIGEVFISENVDSLAATITDVLDNLDKYRAAYERHPEMLARYSWRTERRKLFAVYRELLGEAALNSDIDTLELAPLSPVPEPTHVPGSSHSERPLVVPARSVVVATIVHGSAARALEHEWHSVELTSANWRELLEERSFQLLFVESANPETESSFHVGELVGAFRSKGVTTAYWNTRDPLRYDQHLDSAKLFDVVFTVAEECLPRYREDLGHDRVYHLPFGAQQRIHNPISTGPRNGLLGSTSSHHQLLEVTEEPLSTLLKASKELELDVFDFPDSDPKDHIWPAHSSEHHLGTLDYDQLPTTYKSYKGFVNLEGSPVSASACPAHIFELAASNTPIISPPSPAIDRFFGAGVVQIATSEEVQPALHFFLKSEGYRARVAHLGLRKVMRQHTASHRVNAIVAQLGLHDMTRESELPLVSVVAPSIRPELVERTIATAASQTYPRIEFLLVAHGYEPDESRLRNHAASLGLSDVSVLTVDPRIPLGGLLNRGFSHAKGDYIWKLDDDDFYAPEFLHDLIDAFSYTDAHIVGKAAHFAYLESQDMTIYRGPSLEHSYVQQVHGATMVISRSLIEDVRFPDIPQGSDTRFQRSAVSQGARIYGGDRFNFLYIRAADPTRHTWQASDLRLLTNSVYAYPGYSPDQVTV